VPRSEALRGRGAAAREKGGGSPGVMVAVAEVSKEELLDSSPASVAEPAFVIFKCGGGGGRGRYVSELTFWSGMPGGLAVPHAPCPHAFAVGALSGLCFV